MQEGKVIQKPPRLVSSRRVRFEQSDNVTEMLCGCTDIALSLSRLLSSREFRSFHVALEEKTNNTKTSTRRETRFSKSGFGLNTKTLLFNNETGNECEGEDERCI